LIDNPPADVLSALLARTRDAARLATQPEIMRALRIAKEEAALFIAMTDVTGLWSLEEVTDALTAFADAAVEAGVEWLLKDAAKRGQIQRAPEDVTAEGSGLAILGMGKYGSRELNYSSDIDLVVFYEPEHLPLKAGLSDGEFFVRLTQTLVKLMQERTEDGYVFRTDLRLRPDPGGTPVAVSLPAAEHYYESRGQNWERAAFIKARAVAGDFGAGDRFLKMLTPYIWRKNLDFAAIDDIHSMKRQIHAVGGHGTIAVAGHNIKLGRGGIREIEFFVQTQQLIAGGRDRDLRGKQTCLMLDELARKQWIAPEAADELKTAYRFLRTLEHRLQMIADEQTHTLPATGEGLDHVACFAGFDTRAEFAEVLTGHLRRVQGHYAKLFEKAPPLAEAGGSLVFTGTGDAAPPRFRERFRNRGDHSRLAHRALRCDAEPALARASDRADARAPASAWSHLEPRHGLHPFRPVPDQPAGRCAAFLDALHASASSRPHRRYLRHGAAARALPRAEFRRARSRARSFFLRPDPRPRDHAQEP
jgi:glutamate-ammonia-ligase adenylyltransferase